MVTPPFSDFWCFVREFVERVLKFFIGELFVVQLSNGAGCLSVRLSEQGVLEKVGIGIAMSIWW